MLILLVELLHCLADGCAADSRTQAREWAID